MIILSIIGAISIIIAIYLLVSYLHQRKRLLATLPKNKYKVVEYDDPKEYLLYTCLDTADWKYVHEYKTYQLALSGASHHYIDSLENNKSPKKKRRKKVVHTI
jgi:hypothetical protein